MDDNDLITKFKEFIDNLEETKELKTDEKIAVFNDDKFIGTFKIIKDSKQILAKPEFVLQPIK